MSRLGNETSSQCEARPSRPSPGRKKGTEEKQLQRLEQKIKVKLCARCHPCHPTAHPRQQRRRGQVTCCRTPIAGAAGLSHQGCAERGGLCYSRIPASTQSFFSLLSGYGKGSSRALSLPQPSRAAGRGQRGVS